MNWASGIELGLRLISWVWVRRLLDDWAEAPRLFERNDAALEQIWWHQHYLAAFRSRGSSANNHLVAEAAGLLVGALAFPWFTGSEEQAGQAAAFLERSLADNTFPSGVNREMAFDYHGFVAEVALVAGAEADLAGRPLSDGFWRIVTGMLDAAAASLDVNLRGPRYGDGDDGRALVIGPRNTNRWTTLMSTGRGALGVPDWWPECDPDVASTLLAALIRPRRFPRPERRQAHFADAGMTILRTPRGDTPEIWCRCDAGPHGFLSIAAHAHADALSLEVRHDGIDILADPGTYCYHGEPAWRSYFRSTAAHNTLEVAGRSQSTAGGPFLWRRHANAKLIVLAEGEDGEVTGWAAEHDGYLDLNPPVIHRRQVNLGAQSRHIEIRDIVRTAGPHTVRLAFHVGPTVSISVGEGSADLRWPGPDSSCRQATLRLPGAMKWVVIEGSIDPVLGWYSRGFGEKDPSAALVGADVCLGYTEYVSVLQFQ